MGLNHRIQLHQQIEQLANLLEKDQLQKIEMIDILLYSNNNLSSKCNPSPSPSRLTIIHINNFIHILTPFHTTIYRSFYGWPLEG